MTRYALIGAAGYIAPRHMCAIKETGGDLVAALDPHDSVGVIDSFFPQAAFFTEFERFDRHVEKLRRSKALAVDFVSICSPNYLHDAHIRFALRTGASAICEKPLVLNPWNVDALEEIERESSGRVCNILQLRLHPRIIALRERVNSAPEDQIFEVDLKYLTSRGAWYRASWKGEVEKSGGVATNIGVHFFDALIWIFGPPKTNVVHLHRPSMAAGLLTLQRARVRWFLSIEHDHLPAEIRNSGERTFRSVQLDGEEIEFSDGFNGLHTACYRDLLNGGGFSIADARPSIETVFEIRQASPVGLKGDFHPYCRSIDVD